MGEQAVRTTRTDEQKVRAIVLDQHGTHTYLSTYCVHGLADQCRRTCKTCAAECVCACHHGGRCGDQSAYEVVTPEMSGDVLLVRGLRLDERVVLSFVRNDLGSYELRLVRHQSEIEQ